MFNECCLDAMDYDDNFEMSSTSSCDDNRSPPRSSNGTSSSKDTNLEQLVDMVLRRLGQTYRPQQPYRQQGYVAQRPANGPYACGICVGPHPTEKCTCICHKQISHLPSVDVKFASEILCMSLKIACT